MQDAHSDAPSASVWEVPAGDDSRRSGRLQDLPICGRVSIPILWISQESENSDGI